MAKFKVGQDVTVKRTGAETHVVATDGGNRYILQNGDNVYDYEIKPTPPKKKLKGSIFHRK